MSGLTIVFPRGRPLLLADDEEPSVLRTAAALAQAGAEVVVLAPSSSAPLAALLARCGAPPDARLTYVPVPPAPGFLYTGRLLRQAARLSADVVYTTELEVGAAFAAARPSPGARHVHEAQALRAEAARRARRGAPFFDRAEARLFGAVDGLIVPSDTLAAKARRAYPEAAAVAVVPLASGWAAALDAAQAPPAARARRLGYLGALDPLRGVDVLVEALALLPEHTLSVLGGRPREEEWLRSEAVRFGVLERVHLSGPCPTSELARQAASLDLLLVPARPRERMPYAAPALTLEHLALGRPLVAADLPSIREALGDQAAVLVAPEDGLAWANAIRRIEEAPELGARLVRAARARARAYTWERRAARLLAALRGEALDAGP